MNKKLICTFISQSVRVLQSSNNKMSDIPLKLSNNEANSKAKVNLPVPNIDYELA